MAEAFIIYFDRLRNAVKKKEKKKKNWTEIIFISGLARIEFIWSVSPKKAN